VLALSFNPTASIQLPRNYVTGPMKNQIKLPEFNSQLLFQLTVTTRKEHSGAVLLWQTNCSSGDSYIIINCKL